MVVLLGAELTALLQERTEASAHQTLLATDTLNKPAAVAVMSTNHSVENQGHISQ